MPVFFKSSKVLVYLFYLLYVFALIVLLRTVVLSGFNYRLNGDEVYHVNIVYLMLKGLRPYADLYSTYSPFLHLYLMPVFLIFGATLKAISVSRLFMILLFIIQVFLLFLLSRKVFGKVIALIFVPLFLFDPFNVFVGMQIRPENLMMVFYALFLLVFAHTYYNFRKTKLFFLSGILLALTFLMNLKILPSLLAFVLIFMIYIVKNRLIRQFFVFTNGFCLTILLFFAYFLFKGYLPEMFLGLFIDPLTLNNSIPNPTWLGYFYFQNPVIFGLDGKPPNWIYAWCLPVLAFAGGYAAFSSGVKVLANETAAEQKVENKEQRLMKVILFATLVVQWFSMLFINSVFIQYYIPLNWLYSLFAAYLFHHLIVRLRNSVFIRKVFVGLLLVAFYLLYQTSLQANISRSKMTDDPIVRQLNDFWRLVPENSPAFPNVPFRPPIYPILWGSTFAPYMRDRFPPVYQAIEKHQLPILVGLNDEYFSFLDVESQNYVRTHYQRDVLDNRIWKRK